MCHIWPKETNYSLSAKTNSIACNIIDILVRLLPLKSPLDTATSASTFDYHMASLLTITHNETTALPEDITIPGGDPLSQLAQRHHPQTRQAHQFQKRSPATRHVAPTLPPHLAQKFTHSPDQWLNTMRMSHARHLLRSTRQPIRDIAKQVGFNDQM